MQSHNPVLLNEVLELLKPQEGWYLDCTFGGGGHAEAILKAGDGVGVVALDQDPQAQPRADVLRKQYGERFKFYAKNFEQVETLEESQFSGVLMDLGVSSFQLDEGERGFSFRYDAPADMRMNPEVGQSAAEFIRTSSHRELVRAIRDLGDEPQWRPVVRALEANKHTSVVERTGSLAALISDAMGPAYLRLGKRIHPATLSFQGLRMAVNRELEVLESAFPQIWDKLAPGAVWAVISFHSLEDRIVKRAFREYAGDSVDRFDSRAKQ
ncbi:MAG: 16S rRNA (cytosine(1402)-N(4))-methyltransferase, partial [Verrucomicrobia bacterium 21-51-4]